jgi:hypothetical protein
MSDTTEFDKVSAAPKKKQAAVDKETSVVQAVNTSAVHDEAKAMAEVEKKQRNLLEKYKAQPKVNVRVAPSYAKYFGKMMRVSINGISVTVPCDGQSVALPKTFAAEVERRMAAMDKYENKQQRMANIQNNFESSPGQLTF